MYSTSKRIIAFILLSGQLLTTTSCSGNFNIPIEPQIVYTHQQVDKKWSQDNALVPLTSGLGFDEREKNDTADQSLTKHLPLVESNSAFATEGKALFVGLSKTLKKNKEQKSVSNQVKTFTTPVYIDRSTGHSRKPTHDKAIGGKHFTILNKSKDLASYREQARASQKQVSELSDIGLNVTVAEQLTIDQGLIAKGGHQVYLTVVEGKWMAIVKENAPRGFNRILYLDLYLAPGFTTNQLSKHSPEWQEAHIGVVFPEKSRSGKGHVYIGEKGLLGGGNSGSRQKKDPQQGCAFGLDEKRPDPDKPRRWVCPGPEKHPRTAPPSFSSSSSFSSASSVPLAQEYSRRIDEHMERARQARQQESRIRIGTLIHSMGMITDEVLSQKREVIGQINSMRLPGFDQFFQKGKIQLMFFPPVASDTLEELERELEEKRQSIQSVLHYAIDNIAELEHQFAREGIGIVKDGSSKIEKIQRLPNKVNNLAYKVREEMRQENSRRMEKLIANVNKALEEPLNKLNGFVRENAESWKIFRVAHAIRDILEEIIPRVQYYPFNEGQKEFLPYLRKVKKDVDERIEIESHKASVKKMDEMSQHVYEQVQKERSKLDQLLELNGDLKTIIQAALSFKSAVELLKMRLQKQEFDCQEILARLSDYVEEVDKIVDDKKEKLFEVVGVQQIKKIEQEAIELEKATTKVERIKGKVANNKRKIEEYQEAKPRVERRFKAATEHLERLEALRRKLPHTEEEKMELRSAQKKFYSEESNLAGSEFLIEYYTEKLEIYEQRLREAEKEEQKQKSAEEARKAAARAKELERKYLPSPALQAAMGDIKAHLQALASGLLTPLEQKTQGQALLKQMAALEAEEEASHTRIQAVYQSDNSSEGDQLMEEELTAKEVQLEKIEELAGHLLVTLDLTIEELKDCGIERDSSKGLVRGMASLPLIDTENLPTKGQLEDKLAAYLKECQDEVAFKQLLDTYEVAITKLEASPSNATLKANKEAIEVELQTHQLYKEGFELLMLSTHLREAAEVEANWRRISSVIGESGSSVSVNDLAIAKQKSAEANQIRNDIILELRALFKCSNSPEMGRKTVAAVKGAGKSIEDTAKGALVLASLPVLLCKLG
ncbi:MAG: hypothetical protein ACYC2U_08150, partial [Candidatus Amoebophilus sp.]